ncbi:MAG: hypothetical protein Q7T37_01905 [bacterium]|nr:hypothetical protein [bacterium]MDO8742409.1 hypothetical protein [bacterium]
MSRASILILLGILNVFVPFSGLPMSIRALFAVIVGACVFSIGLSFRSQEAHVAKSRVESAGTDPVVPGQAEISPKAPGHEPHKLSSI